MFRVTPLAVAAGAFLALSASFTNAQVGGPAASFNDVARFVAGQATSPGSSLRQLDNLPAVRRHMTDSVALSKTWQDRRLNVLRDWAKQEIRAFRKGRFW